MGPLSYEEVVDVMKEGKVDPNNTLAWNGTSIKKWIPLSKIPSLQQSKSKSKPKSTKIPNKGNEENIKWYVIGSDKQRIGPIDKLTLQKMVKENKSINNKSLAWNGQTVKQWTPISNISQLQMNEKQNIQNKSKIVWYVMNKNRDRQGPIKSEQELIKLYQNKKITEKSLVWNGKTVKQWTPFNQTDVFKNMQTTNKPTNKSTNKPKNKSTNKPQQNAANIKWYVVNRNKQRQGPLSEDQLKNMYQHKQIDGNCLIWNGNTVKQWTPLSKIFPNLQVIDNENKKKTDVSNIRWYVVTKEKERKGPFTESQLKSLCKSKQFDGNCLVWNGETVKQWTPLKLVTQLQSQKTVTDDGIIGNEHTWYAVTANRQRIGPLTESQLLEKLNNGELNVNSLVFNGTSVQKWTKIEDISSLMKQISNNDGCFWYVASKEKTRLGPFMTQQIIQKFKKGEIQNDTLLCDGVKVKQWTEIQNIRYLMDALKESQLTQKKQATKNVTKNWYAKDVDKNRQGPMDEKELLKMYHDGRINDNSLIYQKKITKQWEKLKNVSYIFEKTQASQDEDVQTSSNERNLNKHMIRSGSDQGAQSLVSVILEVDDIVHKKFINEMMTKRTQIYDKRKFIEEKVKTAKDKERKKEEEQIQREIEKKKRIDPNSLHERAAKVAREWRNKFGEVK